MKIGKANIESAKIEFGDGFGNLIESITQGLRDIGIAVTENCPTAVATGKIESEGLTRLKHSLQLAGISW